VFYHLTAGAAAGAGKDEEDLMFEPLDLLGYIGYITLYEKLPKHPS
jgi:hypothetical protein